MTIQWGDITPKDAPITPGLLPPSVPPILGGLTEKVELYIPSRTRAGLSIPDLHERFIEMALFAFAKVVGGATVIMGAEGAWFLDDGTLIREKMAIVHAYAAQDLALRLVNAAREMAATILAWGDQEAVAVVVNGTMYLVEDEENI